MSRLGKVQIKVPLKTTLILKASLCVIKGPFGSLSQKIPKSIFLTVTPSGLRLVPRNILNKEVSKQLGLVVALLKNKIIGVNVQFFKKLQLIGVGYRAKIENQTLFLSVGFSHITFFPIPSQLQITILNHVQIVITGIDKHAVCLFASQLRNLKPPEPYKGKGIKYKHEIIIKKIGKSPKT